MALFQKDYDQAYLCLLAIFCTLVIATNEVGTKIFIAPFSGQALPCGIIAYPAVFALTDIVSEIWGEKKARLMVIQGFFCSLLNLGIIKLSLALPPHPAWLIPTNPYGYTSLNDYQLAFSSVFSQSHMLILGSMIAYLVGQFIDIRLFGYLKRLCQGKHLWLRNNLSTFTAQLADTLIINTVFFYMGLGMDLQTLIPLSIHYYLIKISIAIIDTPFVYMGVYALNYLKKK